MSEILVFLAWLPDYVPAGVTLWLAWLLLRGGN